MESIHHIDKQASLQPLVSVVTTVKNGEHYLQETLDSVRNQSYKNIEHVVVDDGSTDRTAEILEEYRVMYPNYRLVQLSPGGIGRGKALNMGVSNSTGSWIAIVDGDDLWHPKKLEYQVKYIKDKEIDVLGTGALLFGKSWEIKSTPEDVSLLYKINENSLLKSNLISHSSVILKRELCIYSENIKSQFDYELWLRLSVEGRKIYKIDTILTYHRIHASQSFEGLMGKTYRIRSFKLKMKYCVKRRALKEAFYNTLKLGYDLVLPRGLRLRLREMKNNK